MNNWVAGTTSLVLLAVAGCATPPGVPEVHERVALQALDGPTARREEASAVTVPEDAALAAEGKKPAVAEGARGARGGAPKANASRDVYHEKFVSFVPVGVDQIEVPLGVFQTGAPVEFRVSGSLPYVNDRIESVKAEVDPLTRTVRVTVVARRPAIRLPMLGRYDVRATFIPPTAGYYVLEADGVRKTVVVYGCERQVADAWSARP